MIPMLAGWGKDAKVIAYLGIMKCDNCKNYDHFQLYEVAKKASAFFIPVAKWGKKYYMVCNVCEAGFEIDESQKNEVLTESMNIPPLEVVMHLWKALDDTVLKATENGQDLDSELMAAVARLEAQYEKTHVEYVCAVYAECLQDTDEPE